ncbi:RNA polymerase sigma factor [Sphingomonas sp. AX6]|uniref:RNA polymerase sigma factor n=1 Tax=Sphingomonas sp. AX6 TaxID=2653171 RepID=UPI0012EF2A85|nr:RNA polymerase sigma factor [Sphingomonas sp. AX6]VXC61562.1 RNA polymerase sigma factor CnrH [Sphingomonas sp. AX6]
MTAPSGDSDGALAARSIAGDDRAFAEIVRRHKQFLYGLTARLVGNPDDALDLVQEAFVSAHGALRRYDPDRPMRTWLARIAVNKARDWQRKERVRAVLRSILPLGDVADVAAEQVSVEQAVSDRADLAEVRDRIAKMPAKLREVLVLRTIEGLPQAQVAELLGISEKAVETRLYRARRHLST